MARSTPSFRGNKAGRSSSDIDLSNNAVWLCARSPFRLRMLETIRASGGCTVLEIAGALNVSAPSLYYHIGLLLKSGLIGQMLPEPAVGRSGRLGPVAAVFFATVDGIKFVAPKGPRDQQRLARLLGGMITEHAADVAVAAQSSPSSFGNRWEALDASEVKAIEKAFASVQSILDKARSRREKQHGKAVLASHHVHFGAAPTAPGTLAAPQLR